MNLLSRVKIWSPLSVLERVCIIEGFLKKIQENFVGTLETVRKIIIDVCIREGSVPRGSTVVQQEKEKSICGVFTSSIKCLLTEGILCVFYAVMSKNVQKSVLYVQTSCFAQKQCKFNVFCLFDVFIAVAVVVATALYFDLKGHSV